MLMAYKWLREARGLNKKPMPLFSVQSGHSQTWANWERTVKGSRSEQLMRRGNK